MDVVNARAAHAGAAARRSRHAREGEKNRGRGGRRPRLAGAGGGADRGDVAVTGIATYTASSPRKRGPITSALRDTENTSRLRKQPCQTITIRGYGSPRSRGR